MKVIHFESGLGNQMLNYAEFLYVKNVSQDECFSERIIYEIPECDKVIKQWNGYELERIFGLKVPDIIEKFNQNQWNEILEELRKSEFWTKNWNYDKYITKALSKQGVELKNYITHFAPKRTDKIDDKIKKYLERNSSLYAKFVRIKRLKEKARKTTPNSLPVLKAASDKESTYCGQTLGYMYADSQMDCIDDKIRESFIFPEFNCDDQKNIEAAEYLKKSNAVAIHARRGDFMSQNAILYTGGYFKQAVNYIKNNTNNPEFIIYCDQDSVKWCKNNLKIFGLNQKVDRILFIDWNKGLESFRDMQLMSLCKHNIITTSSFGWWGAFLNQNPSKITISPDPKVRTTMYL